MPHRTYPHHNNCHVWSPKVPGYFDLDTQRSPDPNSPPIPPKQSYNLPDTNVHQTFTSHTFTAWTQKASIMFLCPFIFILFYFDSWFTGMYQISQVNKRACMIARLSRQLVVKRLLYAAILNLIKKKILSFTIDVKSACVSVCTFCKSSYGLEPIHTNYKITGLHENS